MTKIAISPNVNGTGTFTLTAPDSNTDRTLTLPDAAGTVFLSDASNKIQPSSISDGTTSVGTEYVVNGSAKALASIDQTTGTLLDSQNVSSTTDSSVGSFRANFTNSFSVARFTRTMVSQVSSFSQSGFYNAVWTTTATGLQSYNAGAFEDTSNISTACYGDLA